MDFDIDLFEPIDYRHFILGDKCRRAANLRRLNMLTEDETRLVEVSSQYQDCRNDPGHGEFATYSALKLLPYFPDAKREVVFPVTWTHDMGFFGVDPTEWQRMVAEAKARGDLKSMDDEAKRRPHQNRGCMLAGRLFNIAGYPSEEYHFEIADILGDHDTRLLPTTVNGRIMRMGDLLWRTSYSQTQIYFPNMPPAELLKLTEDTCLEGERKHLGEIGVQVGRLDLANNFVYKFGKDRAAAVLKAKYLRELERMIAFYEK